MDRSIKVNTYLNYIAFIMICIGGISHCIVDIYDNKMQNRWSGIVFTIATTVVLITVFFILQKSIKKDVGTPAAVTILIGATYVFWIIWWYIVDGIVDGSPQKLLCLSVIVTMLVLNILFSCRRKHMNVLIIMQLLVIAVFIYLTALVFATHADEVRANWEMDENDYTMHVYIISLTLIQIGILVNYIIVFRLESSRRPAVKSQGVNRKKFPS